MTTNNLEAKLHDTIDDELETVLDYARRKNVKEQRKEYAKDPLFSRFNLDTQEFVLAKSGGGLVTSIHRKVGDLVEKNVQTIFIHQLGIDGEITYDAPIVVDGDEKTRELDALLMVDELDDPDDRDRLQQVIDRDGQNTGSNRSLDEFGNDGDSWDGIGFEIRHCYQSADSKRAQADIAMANHLRANDIMPVMLILCNDANQDIISRYRNYMFVYEGTDSFDLIERISGFDYAGFLDSREDFIDGKMDDVFAMF